MGRTASFIILLCGTLAMEPVAVPVAQADQPTLSGGFDLIELRAGQHDRAFLWDGTFSWGTSADQLMLVTQGGGALGNQIDDAQARLFYGHSIGATTLLAGIRKDFTPHPRDVHAAIGAQGNAGIGTSWETYAFLSDNGRLTGEAQLIHILPLTTRAYLEPRLGIGWSAQPVAADAIRSGFTEAQGTLRLRYRLGAKVNAYVGVVHERLLGATRHLARAHGDAVQSTMAVFGVGFSL